MRVSASVYADSSSRSLRELVTLLDSCEIDYLHFDCKEDTEAVLADIAAVRGYSRTPIDLHVIASKPSAVLSETARLGIERVCFQYEELPPGLPLPASPSGTHFGLALCAETPIEVFDSYAKACDFVMLMTTTPGKSGGLFDRSTFGRIHAFRSRFPGKHIHVDGGVNEEVGFILRLLGVHVVVSGGFLVGSTDVPQALLQLKRSVVHSDYLVEDFMLPLESTPRLSVANAPALQQVMQAIEQQGLGFVCYTAPETGHFLGISSNADVRRGILRHFAQLPKLSWQQLCNKNPVTISPRSNISDLLHLVQRQTFVVSFLPVVNAAQQLHGALTFFHLIQSEA